MNKHIVLTLIVKQRDFIFGAMQQGQDIVETVLLEPDFSSLETCLNTIADGFAQVKDKLPAAPSAISFAFPGPADYPNGIIGDLPNFPLFQGGIALKAFIEHKFSLPTFINNNGNLFTYGEAKAGLLPQVNALLKASGSARCYRSIIGITLGTGVGAGVVVNGRIHIGDNAAGAEIWCMRNKKFTDTIFEDSVNTKALVRVYKEHSGAVGNISAQDVHDIAMGQASGNQPAAQQSFQELGEVLGDGLANILCVIDGLVVVGGSIANAHPLFLPRTVDEINGTLSGADGVVAPRTELTAFNLMEERSLNSFCTGSARKIPVPQTSLFVDYDPVKRIGIGISPLGVEKAMALGAYYFAMDNLGALSI